MCKIYYCVVGISFSMRRGDITAHPSSMDILGVFSTYEVAEKYINSNTETSNYTIVDIAETTIDQSNDSLSNTIVF